MGALFQDPSGYWIPSAESKTNYYFFKSKYINKVGPKITIWIKSVPKNANDSIDIKSKYTLILEECNCNVLSTKMLSFSNYEESDELINSEDIEEPKISYVRPGSVAYAYINDICTRFNKKKK